MKTAGDFITVGEMNKLFGGYACIGTAGVEARILSPTIRRINPYYITPIEIDIDMGAKAHNCVDPNHHLQLDINETLECEIYSNPAAAEQESVVVYLSDQEITPIKGKFSTVRANVTVALAVSAWTYAEVVLVDDLPVGSYRVVGCRAVIDTCVCMRFVPIGGRSRPGVPCNTDKEEDGTEIFRRGGLGEWFKFDTTQLPGVEVLGSAAVGAAAYAIYIDVEKI